MAKNSPSATRTSRMAYCSKSLLPSRTSRFQSTFYPSIRFDLLIMCPYLCVHPFHPLSARCGRHEWIRKILCFPRNLVTPEFHDAHGVGWLVVICQDEFGDPKITAANNSPDREPLFVRLTGALVLYVAPAAGSLAGLRVFQHPVLVIDAVLRLKIVGIGRRPMLIQRCTYRLISRSRLLLLLLIVHLDFHNHLPADAAYATAPVNA